jgi:beta-glucosidase
MEDDLRERLAGLSLEQKVRLLTAADFWSLYEEPAAGLRRLVVSDGPAGVRGERWDERDTSANVPSPTALAATWDPDRVERLGDLLAAECRRKGVDVLLAPTVNLHRTPYGGRHFECFSEDPLLTARIGIAYVNGLQRAGVGATVKHFVANDSETERFTLDARVDERTLRELYLAPFEAIVREARPWAVMAAYNGVNGRTMTESPLLRQVLKDEWGWDGVVMSDWHAARSLDAAAAALDLVMPGPSGPWGDALVAAVGEGRVPEAAVDDKVLRLLRLAARVGALDGPAPGGAARGAAREAAREAIREATPDGANRAAGGEAAPEGANRGAAGGAAAGDRPRGPAAWPPEAVAAELRATAAAGFVLARNHGALLPLSGRSLRRVAIVGPNAAVARTLGGGSATVFPPYTVSPLEGLRAALPRAEVAHAAGVRAHSRLPVADLDVEVRLLAADGTAVHTERRHTGTFRWNALDPAVRAVEVRAAIRADTAGEHVVGASGVGRFRLELDGREAFDETLALGGGADIAEAHMFPPQAGAPVTLAAGQTVDVVLRHDVRAGPGGTVFMLNHDEPRGTPEEMLAEAEALAREADVAIVVAGTNPEVESEGFDRATLALPGGQDELIRRVAAVNPRTVVVVNAGAPVLMPWLHQVPAVLLAWFPGQEGGHALADVLLGAAEPGGRLPTTWPASEDGLPSPHPVDGVLDYAEGTTIGYRRPDRPLLPFGHGLGYTTWEYLGIEPVGEGVRVHLVNAGTRPGREVVQVYADRPERRLVGFAAVTAAAGERAVAEIPIPRSALARWDGGWVVEPGAYAIAAGRSVADLRVRTELAVA